MNNEQHKKKVNRLRRRNRVRARVTGTPEMPRLSVYRSLLHLYVQLIDDASGKTLAASTDKKISSKADKDKSAKVASAFAVGQDIAAKAKQAGIEKVVFDRNGYKYHGRVKALADGARDGGLKF